MGKNKRKYLHRVTMLVESTHAQPDVVLQQLDRLLNSVSPNTRVTVNVRMRVRRVKQISAADVVDMVAVRIIKTTVPRHDELVADGPVHGIEYRRKEDCDAASVP